jgi:hypothetical protein
LASVVDVVVVAAFDNHHKSTPLVVEHSNYNLPFLELLFIEFK